MIGLMNRLRHLRALLRQLWGFAWERREWWIIPVVLVLLVVALLITVGAAVSPFVYPLF